MRVKYSTQFVVAALLFTGGVGTASFAGVSIYQTNAVDPYLPPISKSINSSARPIIQSLKVGDAIGTLVIPRINAKLPIIEGTGTKELKRGVGHYVGSVIPGVTDNSVLSGHRDSVFRRLGEVKIGDLITVEMSYGTFVYEVHKIRIVQADDRTVIVPTKDAILTLSTCYPFRFIGNAPKRYVVQAGLAIGEPVG